MLALLFVACAGESVQGEYDEGDHVASNTSAVEEGVVTDSDTDGFLRIDAMTAMQMIAEHPEVIVLDVRTQEEFDQGYIPGALLIPDYELSARAADELPDKDALILIYCRSGNRSVDAAHTLVDLGYTKIYEFGGILSWPFEVVIP